jgi:leucyl aminopeptidase
MWLNIHFRQDKKAKLNTILEHHKGHVWVSLGPDADALTPRDIVGLMYLLLCKDVVTGSLQIDLLPTKYVDVQSKAFYYYTQKQKQKRKQQHRLHCSHNSHISMIQENQMIMSILSEIKSVIDMPPNVMYPRAVMDYVVKFARRHKVQVLECMDKAELVARGLQGVVEVGRGSTPAHQPHLAVLGLNYRGRGGRGGRGGKKPIVLVGKGVTYDSGGYSLKTPAHMKNMKQDKTGALIVLGVMGVLARLKVSCPIVAILPLAENVLSADSFKPDEIIKSHKGLTVEVSNTDAEGRLLLMDALSLAVQEYEPRAVIDVATLTGVGVFCGKYGAIHGNHLDFEWLIQRIGQKQGDALWVMPPSDAFVGATRDTPVANVKNDNYSVCPMAGAAATVMAAAFLANFVPAHIPWVHLDLGDSKSLYESFDNENESKTNSFLTLIGLLGTLF